MGRLPIYGEISPEDDLDIKSSENPERPPDSHADGCPGSWTRCAFVESLMKFERLHTEHGFAANLLADRTDDRLVIEALQYLEAERVRARAHWREVRERASQT